MNKKLRIYTFRGSQKLNASFLFHSSSTFFVHPNSKMTTMAAVFDPDATTTASGTAPVSIAQLEKNETCDADVEIDAYPDESGRIHQVLDDGTYVPAGDSKMERNAALSSMFVARTLAERHGNKTTDEANAAAGNSNNNTNTQDPLSINVDNAPEWCQNSWKYGEGALYEAGRVLAILECLRTDSQVSSTEAKLQFRRVQRQISKRSDSGPKSGISNGILKEGASILMAKQRSLALSASTVDTCVAKLRKWVKDDNDFSDAFHYLRINACGVRRSNTTGVPLIDVGDGVFSQVERVVHEPQQNEQDAALELPFAKRCLARVAVPPSMYLCIGFNRLENDCEPVAAPIVQNTEDQTTKKVSLETVLRRIRLARVSAFRKMTFERMIREAGEMKGCLDFTVNSVSVESGPYNIVRIDRTLNPVAPNLANDSQEIAALDGDKFRAVQDSSLLQVVVLYQSVQTSFSARECTRQGKGVFDRALGTTNSLKLLHALENILDSVVSLLGVRVVWSRGSSRPDEARAYVSSDEADGDGPSRMLLVVEPISLKNNGGSEEAIGHVRVTPAYGVIIPAPDDPTGRGRTAVLTAQHSTQSGVAPSILFDDVPRSFVSPVLSGAEITATVTLLLCIRLLDAFENVARAGKSEVLDVDRQCFLVVVSSPQSGRTLRAKVWPKGENPGQEVPATTAWFNGKIVEGFPSTAPGRLFAWKKLLDLLVTDKDLSNEPGNFFNRGFRD